MARDKYLCQPCQREGRLTEATEVDHIIPLAKGGETKLSSVQAICKPCHDAKTLIDSGIKPKTPVDADGWPVKG